MMYVLTEEELTALKNAARDAKVASKQKLQAFCTRVANELPVDWGWEKGAPKKPWGCILTVKFEWYCDTCPAKELCPHEPKEYSK